MRNVKRILPLLLLLVVAVPLMSQNVDVKKLPGYIDLEKIRIPRDASSVTDIDLGPGLLGLISLFNEDDEETLPDKLSGLFSIRVKSFLAEPDMTGEIRDIMEKIEKKINSDGWENIVRIKDRTSYNIISIKADKGQSVGTLIMSLDSTGEVTLMNIVGNINLKNLNRFGLGLNDSTLNALRDNWDQH